MQSLDRLDLHERPINESAGSAGDSYGRKVY